MSLPSESDILDLFRHTSPPQFTMKRLLQQYQIPAAERPAFRRRIRGLVAAGRLVRQKGSRYALPQQGQTLLGMVKRHADGYGFVVPDDDSRADVYIPRRYMHGVLHEDRVRVRLVPRSRRQQGASGRVIEILERPLRELIGRIDQVGNTCVLLPLEAHLAPEIYIPPNHRHGVKRGHIAVAALEPYALGQTHPRGRIVEILGFADDAGMEMEVIIRTYALPRSFPPQVEAAAETVPERVRPHELQARRDLRRLLTFTIDGETARDYDDAVSLETRPGGHVVLGVHIADVSHYVAEASDLDRDACGRGTSVYFPDRVIPMLPGRLSNGICCLQPEVDRLTRSVFIELSAAAEVVRYDLVDTVICSQARLTYTQVAEYLEGNSRALVGWNPAIGEVLQRMDALAAVLRQKRVRQGSIDFDLPESDIILDHEGKIDRILRAERNRAHILIEECMLMANRIVAAHLARLGCPALYRVHERPRPEKMARCRAVVQAFGYALPETERLHPGDVQRLLQAVQGHPEAEIIQHLLLRSMPRARYTSTNVGHFGLAFAHYTHFTSPIRRYADLTVHRLLADLAGSGGMSDRRREYWSDRLPRLAAHLSERERIADAAERAVVDLKKAEFMTDRIGQEFNGVITGVTRFGLFVELESLFVEGLVHIGWLPDDFVYYEDRLCLVGQRSGQTYRLGDRVRVRVDNVSVARRQIDFSILARR